jgi:hypothetical protein
MRLLAPLAAAAALLAAGCGSGAGARSSSADATLWVTHDRGRVVVHSAAVRSGVTAAQALEGVAKVKTRYSGEFIQGIDGVEGGGNRDWFYYVNGYAAGVAATDYLLRPGDVEWWDFRHWSDPGEAQLVAGAFPEPFVHGYGGKRRLAVVRYGAGMQATAQALARVVGARSVAPLSVAAPEAANLLEIVAGPPRLVIRYRAGHGSAGDPVEVDAGGAVARALAQDPHRYVRRYAVP